MSDSDSQGDAAADAWTDVFEEDTATAGRDLSKVAEYLVEEVKSSSKLISASIQAAPVHLLS